MTFSILIPRSLLVLFQNNNVPVIFYDGVSDYTISLINIKKKFWNGIFHFILY